MNKLIHGLIALFFCISCWFLWAMLTLSVHTAQRLLSSGRVPAFSQLCYGLRPLFIVLPVLGAAYCLYAWFRRGQGRDAWVGFFAATMATLVLLLLPTLIASALPMIAVMEKAGPR